MARRKRGGGGKRGFYWDGIQVPLTALTATDSVVVIVDATAQEFMPATLMRIRGDLTFMPTTDTSNVCRWKIMYVEINNAGTMTGDHNAFDTHEEDIAQRQLHAGQFVQSTSTGREPGHFEIDVKAKLKLDSASKKLLVMIINGLNATTRTSFACNLRALLLHG